MEVPSFLANVYVQKGLKIHLSRKRLNNQMAAVMLQIIPSFYKKCKKINLFVSESTFKKYIARKHYSIANQDDKMCFYPVADITLY